MNRQQNINEFRRLEAEIAESEAGVEAKKWRTAELAAEAVADGMTRVAYAEAVGKHNSTISIYVRIWDRWSSDVPKRPLFKDAFATIATGEEITSANWNRRNTERRVPTQHEDRVAMAKTLLADPEVVKAAAPAVLDQSTVAGRLLSNAAHEQERQLRLREEERNREARERRGRAAPTLPAYMAKMITQINEWAAGLEAITDDDLDNLPAGRGRELVAETAERLARVAQRWVDRLERKPDLRVIDGNAIRETIAS